MNTFIHLPDRPMGLVGLAFRIGLLAGLLARPFAALGRIGG